MEAINTRMKLSSPKLT